ncbi:homogentisate 1,2-dioxygenase [Haematococcus lacustris]|uniref:homogentisate 1,2-dioxygenase n=1 Tax=Haematococcus lacustris TaxID=44745 RepID=A0A699YIG4_HAELA|nr:homogentisate 1,2-dioxygenase [Haematococcus lacustris]
MPLPGSNGLAAARDFQSPVAWFEDRSVAEYTVQHKFEGQLFSATQTFSPYNVVAWHGNYVPCKYDLKKFCPLNTVAFDHADPSIFTVLTVPSSIQDTLTFENAILESNEEPKHLGPALAFMFETSYTPRVTPTALSSPTIDRSYYKCWMGLKSHFTPPA